MDYDDFLCKPLDKDIIFQALKKIISRPKTDKILIVEDDET